LLTLRNNTKHARGININVHFQFNEPQTRKATIKIENELIDISEDHVGKADLTIITDSETWLKMVIKKHHSFQISCLSYLKK